MNEGQASSSSMLNQIGQLPRQTEISREVARLQLNVEQLQKLSEELIQRLGSVISPKPENDNKEVEDLNPTTPLAEQLHVVGNKMLATEKSLRFILEGIEL